MIWGIIRLCYLHWVYRSSQKIVHALLGQQTFVFFFELLLSFAEIFLFADLSEDLPWFIEFLLALLDSLTCWLSLLCILFRWTELFSIVGDSTSLRSRLSCWLRLLSSAASSSFSLITSTLLLCRLWCCGRLGFGDCRSAGSRLLPLPPCGRLASDRLVCEMRPMRDL